MGTPGYTYKTPQQEEQIKRTRGRYTIIYNKRTKQYHLVRKATNGQPLWWTEGYVNKDSINTVLGYPAYNGGLDFVDEVTVEQ